MECYNVLIMNLGVFLILTTFFIGGDLIDIHNSGEDNSFRKYIAANHKRSYITLTEGAGNLYPLYFESKIAPYYYIRLKDEYQWAIELSPQMIFRMQRKPSFPIRTPSYMPRITYYHNFYKRNHTSNHLIPFVSLVHHSNGQNDNFYNEDGSINTNSGNFATNYIEAGAFFTRPNLTKVTFQNLVKSYASYHFANDPNLKGKYGFFRLNFEYQLIYQLSSYHDKTGKKREKNEKHRLRQSLRAEWIFGEMNDASATNLKERLNFKYTLSYHPKIAEDMSIFIQYYYGQDYYNIHFNENISILRIGLMTDQLEF